MAASAQLSVIQVGIVTDCGTGVNKSLNHVTSVAMGFTEESMKESHQIHQAIHQNYGCALSFA
jgi:hypothetical protein